MYNGASRWAGDTSTTGISRAKDAVAEANRALSYGEQLPVLKPWWRKREDTITPVSGTLAYAFPTAQGTFESLHEVWYRVNGTRFEIPIVDDEDWQDDAIENTAIVGTPEICNLFSDAGNVYKLRFSTIPGGSFISTIDGGVIRLDGYIEESLVTGSADTVEPLMPNSRRWGIVWKAVEYLAALQGDKTLITWAAARGKRYYEMLFADDQGRLGWKTRTIKPMDPIGAKAGSATLSDYGHPRP